MIHSVQIRNFIGIESRTEKLGPAGVVIEGDNGEGKTSFLKAIRAALNAQGIGEDAIRLGAERAEVIIDLDNETVRRTITKSGSSLTVTLADGSKASAPQAYLKALLGAATLDPIELITVSPKERRATILRALPVVVTPEVMQAWIYPSVAIVTARDCEGHGLEAVDRMRRTLFDRRAQERKVVDALKDEAQVLATKAAQLDLVAGPDEDSATLDELAVQLKEAEASRAALSGRAAVAREMAAKTAGTRESVERLRREAAEARAQAGDAEALRQAHAEACEALRQAEELAAARWAEAKAAKERAEAASTVATNANNAVSKAEREIAGHVADMRAAERADAEAARLEESIQAVAPVPAEELQAAQEAVQAVAARIETAKKAAERDKVRADLAAKKGDAEARARVFANLDAAVKALADDAPRTLLAAVAPAFKGLEIDGDEVKLDGKSIEHLSGREQLVFSVELARALNAKSKLLVVDRLEALSPTQLRDFLELATRDGFQLIAARVGTGPAVAHQINRGTK